MTQEDKKLLLIDLCARLPYGVKFQGEDSNVYTLNAANYFALQVEDVVFKPYLRPMSSMTDEEREEWADLFVKPICELEQYTDVKEAQDMAPILYGNAHSISIDWLLSHHFDYRGLIPMGLALEAPEEMYKTE